jgi:hypothetical protein
MRSRTRKPFVTFAASRFLMRDQVISELQETAIRLQANHPDIQAIYLFGSYASGIPTPKSDVDLLIVAEHSSWEDLQGELLFVSVPVDCYVVKPHVFEKGSKSAKGIIAAAVHSGIRLL